MSRGFFGNVLEVGGNPLNIQNFVSPGTFTYTPTSGTKWAKVFVTGSGGKSAGLVGGVNKSFSGGGSGGGTIIIGLDIDDTTTGTIQVGNPQGTGAQRDSEFTYNSTVATGNRGNDSTVAQSANAAMSTPAQGGVGDVSGVASDFFLFGVFQGGHGDPGVCLASTNDGWGGNGGGTYWGAGGIGSFGFDGTNRHESGSVPHPFSPGGGAGGSGQTDNTSVNEVFGNPGMVAVVEYA